MKMDGRTMRELIAAVFAALLWNAATLGTAAAQAPAAEAAPGLGAVLLQQLPLFAMVFAIFYLLVLRPQQTKLRAHQELIKGLKRGDHIITSGGIFGRVVAAEGESVSVEIAPNVKIKVESSHVVRKQGEPAQENGASKGGQKAAAG